MVTRRTTKNVSVAHPSPRSITKPPKTFALALGGGGARSLAHIAVIEVLDELGARPIAIAGASLGALVGAAYASGMTGKELRHHAITFAHDRRGTLSRLMGARAGTWSKWLAAPLNNPMLIDAVKFCDLFLPASVPDEFAKLAIPLTVIATDFYARCELALTEGPLKVALAASLAIPGLLRPVEHAGRVLVDGAAVNPLPFDRVRGVADVIIAVDCTGGPTEPRGIPDPWEGLFATIQVMGQAIVAEKLKHGSPDLVIRPEVASFRLLDFFQASAILRAADPIKRELRSKLPKLLRL